MNEVKLIGFLGQDAELKKLDKGALLRFSIATDDGYYDNQKKEWISNTQWHNVIAWNRVAENNAFLERGEKVFVSGRLVTREYQKDDGETVKTVQVEAYKIEQIVHTKSDYKNESTKNLSEEPKDLPF